MAKHGYSCVLSRTRVTTTIKLTIELRRSNAINNDLNDGRVRLNRRSLSGIKALPRLIAKIPCCCLALNKLLMCDASITGPTGDGQTPEAVQRASCRSRFYDPQQ